MGNCLQTAFAVADGEIASSASVAPVLKPDHNPFGFSLEQPGMERLFSAIDHERRRIGQELHDSAGQLIACLQLSIARLEIEDPEHAGRIHEIQAIAHEISDEIRSLSFLNYPVELASRGLVSSIAMLARGFASRTGIRTDFEGDDDVAALGDTGALALLRVTQEALVNVYRHAKAKSVKVSLRRHGSSIELTVRDDGIGLSHATNESFGIGRQSMRHRVEVLGGEFRMVGLKTGCKVFASVPLSC